MLQQSIDNTVQVSRCEPEGEVILNRRKEEEEEKEKEKRQQQIERDKGEEHKAFEDYTKRRTEVKRGSYTFLLRDDQNLRLVTEQKPVIPELAPFPSTREIEKFSLLEALREETAIKDPDTIYEKCCENVKCLSEYGTLDKYILSDEEAAVLCATTKLTENGLDLSDLFQSSKGKTTNKLVVLLLKSLRKLPQYRGTLYFGRGSDNPMHRVRKSCFMRHPFCFASSSMTLVREELEKFKFKEIFKTENCWGYDISDFVCTENKGPGYCKMSYICTLDKSFFLCRNKQ